MHLTQAQFKRFTRLLYSLLNYANEKHSVLGETFAPWEDDGGDQIADLSTFVFEDHREVIGQYLAENPDELADSALAQIAQWGKAAFADAFFVIEVSKDYTTLIGDEFLFNVTGLDCEAAVDLGQPGDAVFTVLLPFEDHIVYGMVTEPVPDTFDDIRDQVAADALAMLAEGLVASTSADLLKIGPGCVERSVASRKLEIAAFDRALGGDKGERAGKAQGKPGTHVGVLSGMAQDERKAAILDHVKQAMPQFDEIFGKRGHNLFLHCAPEDTVAGALAQLTKQELYDMTRDFGLAGCSKMNKQQLASTLESELIVPGNVLRIMASLLSGDRSLALAEKTFEAGGTLGITAAEHNALPEEEKWQPFLPFMNIFEHDGAITSVIPSEVMTMLRDAGFDELVRKLHQVHHARHLVDTYREMCGIVSIDELTNTYLDFYPNELSRLEFSQVIYDFGEAAGEGYDVWTYRGEPHVLHYSLVDPQEIKGVEGPADIDGDAQGSKPSQTESWRRSIKDRHDQIKMWEIPNKSAESLEAFDWLDFVEALPSHRALQAFLDAHVPNGKDDYLFADKILEDLYSMVNYGAGPEALVKHMQDQGLVLASTAESGQLLMLLSLLVNDLPRWENNGWSAKELEELRNQK